MNTNLSIYHIFIKIFVMRVRGGKISNINKVIIFSIVFTVFLMIGSVSAIDSNVTIDDSNLLNENNKIVFSLQNLEVSSDDSIPETPSHDDNYSSDEDEGLFTSQYISDDELLVNDAQSTSLAGNDTELYFKNGTAYEVVLSDSEGTLLANQSVIFNINGNNYTRTTNDQGIASILINLNSGDYTIGALFAGTSSYESSSTTNIVKVLSTISGEDVEKYYRNDTQYYATFVDGQGALLNNTPVAFNINGVFYERKTNENGTAKLNINLNSGDYILTAINLINGEMCSNNITVLSTIAGDDVVKYYKNDTQYYATFVDNEGNLLTNTNVTFNINGVYYTRTTNDSGMAKLNINLNPDNYTITAINPINGEMHSNNIEVLPTISADDLNMIYRNSSFVAYVIDDEGNPLVGGNVTFNINGIFYTRVTGNDGDAHLNINLNVGNYTITSTTDNGLSVSNIITINKAKSIINGNDAHIILGTDRVYAVNLIGENNKSISNANVYFKYANLTQTAISDENGLAEIPVSNLSEGTYDIEIGFDGNWNYYSSNITKKFLVANSTVILSGNDISIVYNDGSRFNVTLTDLDSKPLVNETITFTINGMSYNRTTNDGGVAGLSINLIPGTYEIFYSYSNVDSVDYNEGTNTIVVDKMFAEFIADDLAKNYSESASFVATLVDKNSTPIANTVVSFTINGVSYNRTTNESGVAKLNIALPVGYYEITTSLDNVFYSAKTISNHILVNGTIFEAEDLDILVGTTGYFSVTLLDAYYNPISNASIQFNYSDLTVNNITDSDGIATIEINGLNKGLYPITYSYDNESNVGLSFINVVGTISLNDLISAANSVNQYIEVNAALPSNVLIGEDTFSTAQYLYLISEAIIGISNGDYSDLYVFDVSDPDSPGSASNMGSLSEYVALASSVFVSMTDGVTPNSVDTSIGTIGYDGIVYALTRVIVYYGLNNNLPSSVSIKSLKLYEPQSSIKKKNTITDLTPYLSSSTNCQVTNAQIVALANSLTQGLTNSVDKAKAIYNYVRDQISYSFYYDTHYGAVGTLNAGTGNCVDQAHLSIALYRAAGLPARYVHGTCVFSSGSTYGHVWAQVLIGDTWIVSDSTSTRNSFDNVVNWNNYNYSLNGYYSSISF